MRKLSAKQARERGTVDPTRIASSSKGIARTFPGSVAPEAITAFIHAVAKAVEHYLAYLPIGKPLGRKHRITGENPHAASPHRPADSVRHGLIWDLYEAYMTARGDDPALRGFKKTADAVLSAAGLPLVSEYEQTHIREQIKVFAAFAEPDEQTRLEK